MLEDVHMLYHCDMGSDESSIRIHDCRPMRPKASKAKTYRAQKVTAPVSCNLTMYVCGPSV